MWEPGSRVGVPFDGTGIAIDKYFDRANYRSGRVVERIINPRLPPLSPGDQIDTRQMDILCTVHTSKVSQTLYIPR